MACFPPRGSALLVFLSSLLMAVPLLTQERSVPQRLEGRVLGLDDRLIAGATVTLRPVEPPGNAQPPEESDSRGRWSVGGLAPGRWEITVKARDFRTSLGWIVVRQDRPTSPLTVWMRPLAEVTPLFAENPQSVIGFIEMGNDLLEQGYYERARQEYEKAILALPVESRPEVLRSVARTYFLQDHIEETIRTLQEALVMAPADPTTRKLFRSVLRQQDRLAEAESLLAALDRGEEVELPDPSAAGQQATESGTAGRLQLPLAGLSADRTGRYRASLSEVSPKSDLARVLVRLGVDRQYVERHDPHGGEYNLADESFQVYVPLAPPPPAGYGLLVWISPTPVAGFVSDEIRPFLEEHGLIWIGADNSGNARPGWYRMMLALDAVHNLKQFYSIDEQRIYAAGYSGGGRITSSLVQLYPEVFRGGISLFGCDYMAKLSIPFKPGAHWPAAYPPPPRDRLRAIKRESRFVLITGEWDFNRAQTKATYEQMLADGFENVVGLVIPDASHYSKLKKEWLDPSILFLDEGTRPQGTGWSSPR